MISVLVVSTSGTNSSSITTQPSTPAMSDSGHTVMAQATVDKIGKLEEIYKGMYGSYTEDLKRLAALTGNPDAVRREIMKTLEPDTLVLATNGRAYMITAKAKNWLKTEVTVTSLPPQKR